MGNAQATSSTNSSQHLRKNSAPPSVDVADSVLSKTRGKARPMRRSLPRLPRHVLRLPEVMAHLDRWAPITVVRGIQGYGKTVAVSAWLADLPSDVLSVWLNARSSQDDPGLFGQHLERELERARLGDTRAVARSDQSRDPAAALDRLAAAHADERLVVVIDDAHALDDERILQSLLDVVTRRHNAHLVLCSRGAHRIERMAAGVVEVHPVPARALLMSDEQILELARLMDVPLTAEQALQLHRAFGGWAAAVQLVLAGVNTPVDDLPLARAADYLRDTVLPHVGDRRMVHEIARFALAERLTHDLIRDLAGDHGPEALVRLVEAPGLAERRYEGAEVVLELPSFIKSALRDLFIVQEPEATQDMHQRLATWYASNDGPRHPLYALHHAVAARDWTQVDVVWAQHSLTLVVLWPGDLGRILRHIPPPVIASRPGMCIAREMTRAPSRHGSHLDSRLVRRSAYIDASRHLAAQGLGSLPVHDLLYVGTGHLAALRAEGRLVESGTVGDDLEAAATTLTVAGQDAGDRLPIFHLQRGLTHTLLDQHPAAIHRYQLAWRTRHLTVAQIGAGAAGNLALTHALVGDRMASRRWLYHHASFSLQPSWANELVNAGARIAAGLLSLDLLDPDGCSATLELLRSGPTDLELGPLVDCLEAQHHLHFGSSTAGLAILDAALSARPPAYVASPVAAAPLLRVRADLLLAAGHGHRARSLLAAQPTPLDPRLAVVSARISIVAGDPLTARQLTSSLIWRKTTDNRTRQDLLLLHALAAHRLGDLKTSANMTNEALALYRSTHILRSFASLAPEDLDALLDTAGATLRLQDLATIQKHPSPYPRGIDVITLTPREQLLAAALASHASRQEIADQFYLSVNTVRSQLATLYRKLGVGTRDEALARLADLGMLQRTLHESPTPSA